MAGCQDKAPTSSEPTGSEPESPQPSAAVDHDTDNSQALTADFDGGIGVMLSRVDIPMREHGYKNLESRVIQSADALALFLQEVDGQKEWSGTGKSTFASALKSANLDFDISVLLLLCDTRGSGSIRVWVETPRLVGKELIFKVESYVPQSLTTDMAYRCFAYSIPRYGVETIRITGANSQGRFVNDKNGQRHLIPPHSNDIVLSLASPPESEISTDQSEENN